MKFPSLFPTFLLTAFGLSAGLTRVQAGLAEAVDTPALTWVTGGDESWQALDSPEAKSGNDLARCGPMSEDPFLFLGLPTSGWMETTLTGPGTFRIFVRSNRDPYLSAALSVDGVENEVRNFEFENAAIPSEWRALSCVVPPGGHTVRLTAWFGRNGAGTLEIHGPIVEADFASLSPPVAAAGTALEAPGLTWLSAGDPGLTIVQDVTHDGTDAVFFAPQQSPAWLQTEVTGPVTLTWWRKGAANVSVDGGNVTSATVDVWTRESAFIPPGTHTVRWQAVPDAGQADPVPGMWLDELSTISESAVTLTEALEAPAQVFTTSPGWQAHTTSIAGQGGDLAWVRVTDTAQRLDTTVTGPALVESAWRARGGGVEIHVQVDGRTAAYGNGFPGSETTGTAQVVVPAGLHTVRWEAVPYNNTSVNTLFMVDAVSVSPASAAQLDAALDAPGLTWTTGGDVPWQGSPARYAHDTTDMACSPELAEGQTAWVETTITGPGTLSLWLRSLFYYTPMEGTLTVDNRRLHVYSFNSFAAASIGSDWRREVLELPAGSHTIRFQTQGESRGGLLVLDEAAWTPSAALPFSAALDIAPAVLHSAGSVLSVDTAIHTDGVDSLRMEPPYRGGPPEPVTLWVDGPALLTCKARAEGGGVKAATEISSASTALQDWTSLTVAVPPGRRAVEFSSVETTAWYLSPVTRAAWVDAVTLTPNAAPLVPSLGTAGLVWSTNPNNPWTGIAESAGLPQRAASGPVDPSEISWLETTVTGPALLTCNAMGWLALQMDGVFHSNMMGTTTGGPARCTCWVPPGTHTLRWTSLNGNGALYAVWVFRATGEPSLTLSGGVPVFTVPMPAPAPNGGQGYLIRIETATSPGGPWSTVPLDGTTIIRSDSSELVVRLPVPPASTRLFAHAIYQ